MGLVKLLLTQFKQHWHTKWRFLIVCLLLISMLLIALMSMTTRFIVDGDSMQPTLQNEQHILVNTIAYVRQNPQRGDIIVFSSPINPDQQLIKRIVALPSETIEFRATAVYIDGERLPEPYLVQSCLVEQCSDRFWQLGDDEYFVMGDNRNHSSDSRVFDALSSRDIVGQAIVRFYPFSQVKWLD